MSYSYGGTIVREAKLIDEHPEDCKGCPDCPGTFICAKYGQSFTELDTTHKCEGRRK